MSGELGTHQGLRVTIVATATLEDLKNKTGMAHTGGGTLLPAQDLIRMAAHAHNYLLIFDEAKKCQLYRDRTTRLATLPNDWCCTPLQSEIEHTVASGPSPLGGVVPTSPDRAPRASRRHRGSRTPRLVPRPR